MTASSSSGNCCPISDRETAACRGFIDERANTTRSGSPAEATSRPSTSHTATWPTWIDSTRPDRTTVASGTAPAKLRAS